MTSLPFILAILGISASNLWNFAESSTTNEIRFRISGTITSFVNLDSFMLEDASGVAWFKRKGLDETMVVGDIVEVAGHTKTDFSRAKTLHVDRAIRKGHVTPDEPVEIPFKDIDPIRMTFRVVRTHGTVINQFVDEINPLYTHLILRSGETTFHAAYPTSDICDSPRNLIGSQVRITGTFLPHQGGERFYSGSSIAIPSESQIEILQSPDSDVLGIAPLQFPLRGNPAEIVAQDRRRITGTVAAVWHRNRFLLKTDEGMNVQVVLAGMKELPASGDRVCAIGFPDTDLMHINLIDADYQIIREPHPPTLPPPVRIEARQLLLDENGQTKYAVLKHGTTVTVVGKVRDLPPIDGRINLDCEGCALPIDISAHPSVLDNLEAGCAVEVTGVCIADIDSWRPNVIVPRVKGIFLVIRTPMDIRILERPPWWTVRRLFAIILALSGILVLVLIWNRTLNHLVNRRSRQLVREQLAHTISELKIGERTRLAVELHDSLSQNLAGIACQISAGRKVIGEDDASARSRLSTAEKMLAACRTELRYCLTDLRSDTLEEHDFQTAILRSIEPLASDVKTLIRFKVPRAKLQDATAHAILCIIRELVSNAITHGKASELRIAGAIDDNALLFSVSDNGNGFDPEHCPDARQGHFGLDGIRGRLRRMDGQFTLTSAIGQGTKAIVRIPFRSAKSDSIDNP